MFIKLLDRNGLRWLLAIIVIGVYKSKGQKIENVFFNNNLMLWEYQIGKSFFVTETASWFSSDSYYLQTLKKYACNFYLPQTGDVVIDIGAGVGEELLSLARQVGDTGQVLAVEANPRTFFVLDYITKKNKLSNVTIYNKAIASRNEIVSIEDNEGYGVQNSIHSIGTTKTFNVEAQSLDEFIQEQGIERIDFLKVNIEGAEQFLIQGMDKSLLKIRHFAISCHDFRSDAGESSFFRTRKLVIDFFKPHFDLSFQQSGDAVRDNYVYGTNKTLVRN